MQDLIKRSDAIKAMRDTLVAAEIPYAVNALFKVPTVEQKCGEWVTFDTQTVSIPVYWNKEQKESDEKGAGIQEKCKCSVCGWKTNFMGYKKLGVNKSFNFCPNCGADMRGPDDE